MSRPAESAERKKSPMALRKLGGSGLGGREADQSKAPVRKMAKSDSIAEVWLGWSGGGGSVSRPAESARH